MPARLHEFPSAHQSQIASLAACGVPESGSCCRLHLYQKLVNVV